MRPVLSSLLRSMFSLRPLSAVTSVVPFRVVKSHRCPDLCRLFRSGLSKEIHLLRNSPIARPPKLSKKKNQTTAANPHALPARKSHLLPSNLNASDKPSSIADDETSTSTLPAADPKVLRDQVQPRGLPPPLPHGRLLRNVLRGRSQSLRSPQHHRAPPPPISSSLRS
jgi:hypothetical protein